VWQYIQQHKTLLYYNGDQNGPVCVCGCFFFIKVFYKNQNTNTQQEEGVALVALKSTMSLAKKATVFTVAWFLIYLVAYIMFIAPSLLSKGQSPSPADKVSISRQTNSNIKRISQSLTDPFVPTGCSDVGDVHAKVGIVVAVHDEKPYSVIQTVSCWNQSY
jgi:hypothetical protein